MPGDLARMRNKEVLPIYIEAYRLTQDILNQTVKFPKEYKFLLGTQLNEASIELCCLITNTARAAQKQALLEQIFNQLDKIKIEFRLCTDFKLLSNQQQASIATRLEKITGQAIAWLKSERRKQSITSMPESGTTPSYPE